MNEREISLCIEWISAQQITKNLNRYRSSYGLKHIVENWAGEYVSNDSFIEAIKRLGLKYKYINKLNIAVPLAEKTIKKYTPRFRGGRFGHIEIKPLKRNH